MWATSEAAVKMVTQIMDSILKILKKECKKDNCFFLSGRLRIFSSKLYCQCTCLYCSFKCTCLIFIYVYKIVQHLQLTEQRLHLELDLELFFFFNFLNIELIKKINYDLIELVFN